MTYKVCAACGKNKPVSMYNKGSWRNYDRVCRECRRSGAIPPPMAEKERRLERRAYLYAREVLMPVYGDMTYCIRRARSAYGL